MSVWPSGRGRRERDGAGRKGGPYWRCDDHLGRYVCTWINTCIRTLYPPSPVRDWRFRSRGDVLDAVRSLAARALPGGSAMNHDHRFTVYRQYLCTSYLYNLTPPSKRNAIARQGTGTRRKRHGSDSSGDGKGTPVGWLLSIARASCTTRAGTSTFTPQARTQRWDPIRQCCPPTSK